jgi:ComF family protein
MHRLYAWLLELFFPDRCVICEGPGGLLCATCVGRLRPYPNEGLTPGLDAMAVAWLYDGAVRQAVHSMKYRRRRRVADALADALADAMPAPPADALVPVPLHPERLAERGFNQAEELARRLGRRWGLPVCASGLTRARDTGHQARLHRAERRANVAGAFVWAGPGAPPVRPLLVDDVLTTGSTLAACAEALRAAGAREVRAVALARSLGRGAKPTVLQ